MHIGLLSDFPCPDPSEMDSFRRLKRSFDGFISFRKAVFIGFFTLIVILYLGPTLFGWIFGSGVKYQIDSGSCVDSRLSPYLSDVFDLTGHTVHRPWRPLADTNYLPYVGNGYIGLSTEESDVGDDGKIHVFAGQRHLSAAVPFRPLVKIVPSGAESEGSSESASLLHYQNGMVIQVDCFSDGVSVTSNIYAHRALSKVMVQEVRVTNPGAEAITVNVQRMGITQWKGATSEQKTLEHGEGNQQYVLVSGQMEASSLDGHVKNLAGQLVSILFKKLPSTLEVAPRMTQTLTVLTAVAYTDLPRVGSKMEINKLKKELEDQATESLLKAASTTILSLREWHLSIWRGLWNTGFAISHSMAENAVNGRQINATMYYVLAQTPAPMHSAHASEQEKSALAAQLAYAEGCYGGIPTIHATTLWSSLVTLADVNAVVRAWMVTLEKNGCHKLLKTGADGVIQAMVLSFVALKFREEHLELNSNPKDLHRDYHMRRVSYGNGTHLNISIVVDPDNNKAFLQVALDRKHRDYFACDAGCLDAPVRLGTQQATFPVKLTDPLTAILYITSDQQHMMELKDAIHFKVVAEAPAHEHHVLALHRHGNKLGGLPTIFWFSIGFLILVFHGFLFKLIYQEYCSSGGGVAILGGGGDKFRARKYSDYH